MSVCAPDIAQLVSHIAGSVVSGQQIGWETLTRELEVTRGCTWPEGTRVRVSTDLVVRERAGSFTPLAENEIPNGRLPATLRHCPWLKLRLAACDDPTIRPVWLDLGQSIVVPASSGSAAIVGPADRSFFLVTPANQGTEVPPAGAEQSTIDAWVYVRVEPTTCCEPSDALLTDSGIVPDTAAGTLEFIIPPRARCLTIHKGDGSDLAVEWVLDGANLIVETAGMPAAASQLVLTVPEAYRVRLASAGGPQNVVLVWSLRL